MSVRIVTFGCRLNIVESEGIAREARAAGHRDLTVVNTCAVTAEAARQSRQAVRRAVRERPDGPVVVTGCAAEIEPDRFRDLPGVTAVVGNARKASAAVWRGLAGADVGGISESDGAPVDPHPPGRPPSPFGGEGGSRRRRETDEGSTPHRRVWRDPSSAPAGHLLPQGEKGFPTAMDTAASPVDRHTRGFVEVQNGCDHRCTFCIIPFGRGASRSIPPAAAVRRIQELVEAGAREVVLTGVDVTAYDADGLSLGQLVRRILAEVPALPRLRLSSLDCIEADAALLACLAEEPRLMPHLHLSIQSGADLILKRMARRHRRADVAALCREIRRLRPDVAFGADVIAGFPTETEQDFAETLDLVAACDLAFVHAFPFSPRPGTAAARMPAVPGAVVSDRAARLRQLGTAQLSHHLDRQVGRTLAVLSERGDTGHAEDFTRVRLPPGMAPGTIVQVATPRHDGRALDATSQPFRNHTAE